MKITPIYFTKKALKFKSGRLIYFFLMYKNEIIYKLYTVQDLFWKKQITKKKSAFHISQGLYIMYTFF